MTEKVWLVTTGEYSSYRIVAAFITKELAGAYAEHYGGDGGSDVEEHELRSALPDLHAWLTVETDLNRDGTVLAGPAETVTDQWADERFPVPSRVIIHPNPNGRWSANPADVITEPVVQVAVEGIEHERVRKVHSEALAKAKAQAALLLSTPPEDRERSHLSVDYRLAHELTDAMNADMPWRGRLHGGWGAVYVLLTRAGVTDDQADRLARAVCASDPVAGAEIDWLLSPAGRAHLESR